MDVLFNNAFANMPGAPLVIAYVALMVLVTYCGSLIRRIMDKTGSRPPPPLLSRPDPYQFAFLSEVAMGSSWWFRQNSSISAI